MSDFSRYLSSKRSGRFSAVMWLLIPVCLSPLSFAHAYLDAGTGSYVIQVAIGVIFGATYTLKTFSGKIKQFFKDQGSKRQKNDE